MLRDGRRQVGGFYFSGDVIGLEAAAKHTLAAQAITDVRVRIVKKQTLSALALSDYKVADRLLSLTARDLTRKQRLALLLSRSAQERVIGFIIEMAQHGTSKGDRIALPMTRQDIADYLGLKIETVSRILHDLERRGAIKINGYRSIALRNQFVERRAEELTDLFEGLKVVRQNQKALAVFAAPICAFLPNATVVILMGPLVVGLCERMKINFIQPMILLVFIANSSGLLTLVGDPATFIVGNAVGVSFTAYLRLLSPGGVLAIVAVLVMLPLIFRSIWRLRAPDHEAIVIPPIKRPGVMVACLAVVALMIALFVYGEQLPNPIAPPEAAIIGSALLLTIAFATDLDPVGNILRDVDWESLLFLVCVFVLVGALDKTGVIGSLGNTLGSFFGNNVVLASLLLLFGIGVLSSVIPNVALVVAMLPLVKQYAVGAGLATTQALEAGYGQMPSSVLPLFFAMCFGATLGGNATLLGAGSNIIAGGICARAGRPISFLTFLRYGLPVTAVQLLVSALYIWIRFL